MRPPAPQELLQRAAQWNELRRWDRAEVGRALRRLGWTYSEIREVISVPKGTLSGWCRDVRLSPEQVAAIKERGLARHAPGDTQWRRHREIKRIKTDAAKRGRVLARRPLWTAGVALYWAEGSKTTRCLALANSDPAAIRLFMHWVSVFLDRHPAWVLSLNLHADNDERAAREFWKSELRLACPEFTKTFIKPQGTGHRKNHLPHGVCRIRMRRSTDAWITTMAWIEVLCSEFEV